MYWVTDSLVQAFVHTVPGVYSFDFEFFLVERPIGVDQLIAHVFDFHHVPLPFETVDGYIAD